MNLSTICTIVYLTGHGIVNSPQPPMSCQLCNHNQQLLLTIIQRQDPGVHEFLCIPASEEEPPPEQSYSRVASPR